MKHENGWDQMLRAYERQQLLESKPLDQIVVEIHEMLTFLLTNTGFGHPMVTLMEIYQKERNEKPPETVRSGCEEAPRLPPETPPPG
jgi:hypothetical protein